MHFKGRAAEGAEIIELLGMSVNEFLIGRYYCNHIFAVRTISAGMGNALSRYNDYGLMPHSVHGSRIVEYVKVSLGIDREQEPQRICIAVNI